MRDPRVFFDRGPLGSGTAFVKPRQLIKAQTLQEVPQAFYALEQAHSQGCWLAGYAAYELGYAFSSKLRSLLPAQRNTPLLLFGVFEKPEKYLSDTSKVRATLSAPVPEQSFADYAKCFEKVKKYIVQGDIYQANLTFPLSSTYTGTTQALYLRLCEKQKVSHGALVALEWPILLSRSPELFFAIDKDGKITARPMKGTAPRGQSVQEDEANIRWLQSSPKNRSENLMIVDLLRNDIGRISEIGSLGVPELFKVERYTTLHQMTSCITAHIRKEITLYEIFAALFPCGSVTGAPKIRAMQIIQALECRPRDAYCGAIGWIAPDKSMEFSVAIRTLMCYEDKTAHLGVGGGIVYDSTAQEEYNEALLKARYASFTPKL